ncbi:MAG: hypothetical protein LUC27_09125 [Lachnospiraceae bacterium]|nr:hypothetical protein [Lachnospiraceae bacterium]
MNGLFMKKRMSGQLGIRFFMDISVPYDLGLMFITSEADPEILHLAEI